MSNKTNTNNKNNKKNKINDCVFTYDRILFHIHRSAITLIGEVNYIDDLVTMAHVKR